MAFSRSVNRVLYNSWPKNFVVKQGFKDGRAGRKGRKTLVNVETHKFGRMQIGYRLIL